MEQITANTCMFDEYDDLVTTDELAKMLRIGRNSAYGLVRAGVIPSVTIGRRQKRISKRAIIDYINNGDVGN
jgi:excisionase family DNA binding protein